MFTAASALCGLAWNLPSLVLFRMLQGLGGGAIIPTAQSILFARYPRKEHGTAGALFCSRDHGPAARPHRRRLPHRFVLLSRIFLINVPIGLFAAGLRLPQHRGARLRAARRADRHLWHRAARGRHGLARVRARGRQPQRLVPELRDRRAHRGGRRLARHLRRPPAREPATRSSICASSRTSRTARRPASTSSSASRCSRRPTCSRCCGAVVHYGEGHRPRVPGRRPRPDRVHAAGRPLRPQGSNT